MPSPAVPPGWPQLVPPPESHGWQVPAVSWLLDFCPSEYRLYAGWRRQPVALAWVTTRHIDAQLVAMRQAYREVRVELGDHLTTDGLTQVLADLEAEGVRLLAARRSAGLVYDALQGKRYVPRLQTGAELVLAAPGADTRSLAATWRIEQVTNELGL